MAESTGAFPFAPIHDLAITDFHAFFLAVADVAFQTIGAGSRNVAAAGLAERSALGGVVFAANAIGEDEKQGDQDR